MERLQKALGIRSVNWLSEKLSLLRSLGSIEEISGKAKKKTATGDTQSGSGGGNGGEGGIRSLESLLSQEELRKVREKVGEVGGGSGNGSGVLIREGDGAGGDAGQLGVLLEYVLFRSPFAIRTVPYILNHSRVFTDKRNSCSLTSKMRIRGDSSKMLLRSKLA